MHTLAHTCGKITERKACVAANSGCSSVTECGGDNRAVPSRAEPWGAARRLRQSSQDWLSAVCLFSHRSIMAFHVTVCEQSGLNDACGLVVDDEHPPPPPPPPSSLDRPAKPQQCTVEGWNVNVVIHERRLRFCCMGAFLSSFTASVKLSFF